MGDYIAYFGVLLPIMYPVIPLQRKEYKNNSTKYL